ncbi:hypothetical protein B0T25DRAFT_138042 [Lasiosphaeria hispida]|uniref:Heterokaryon incompatibility domain-containing protein n=1 Tax=Lasiosphaeria hispida TaxID=260671 RepID=A0AAJ0HKR6_9PEZI|nr:hypothetical protein B0T25DRAFT_138042 [Lasiosphaeria hispida]
MAAYTLLNTQYKETRLLLLHAGSGDEPIRCSLHIVSLHHNPKYEAVSYVWGSQHSNTPMTSAASHSRTLTISMPPLVTTRPWWSRIWTAQECILPPVCTLLYGPVSMPWDTVLTGLPPLPAAPRHVLRCRAWVAA